MAGMAGAVGDIILRCVPNLNTLIDFRYTQHFRAASGKGGAWVANALAQAPIPSSYRFRPAPKCWTKTSALSWLI